MTRFEPGNYRAIGSTGILVSPIGLGTVKFGRNTNVKYPHHYDLPDDQTLLALLRQAQDLGINLLDTAPAYGSSETRIGSLIQPERDNWVLATKVGEHYENGASSWDFSEAATRHSIETSLSRLKTDHLDIVLVHSNGDNEEMIPASGAFDALRAAKSRGDIRTFGVSTKTLAGALCALDHCDLIMVSYSLNDREQEPAINKAMAMHKGVLIKKALESGHATDPAAALTFALEPPAVASVIVGTTNKEHLADNVAAVTKVMRR